MQDSHDNRPQRNDGNISDQTFRRMIWVFACVCGVFCLGLYLAVLADKH